MFPYACLMLWSAAKGHQTIAENPFSIDAGDVTASRLGLGDNAFLALHILSVSADSEIDTGDLHS